MGDHGDKMNHKNITIVMHAVTRHFQWRANIKTYNRGSLFTICSSCMKFNIVKITVNVFIMDSFTGEQTKYIRG